VTLSDRLSDRFRLCAAVYGVLVADGRVLLMRRAGSGYKDGTLALPAGHLDGGEDAVAGLIRELREETGVEAPRSACRLATVVHSGPGYPGDEEYLNLFFTVAAWTGTPEIREPDKCTALVWADPADLPPDTIDYLPAVLAAIAAGEPLLLADWAPS
jgi:ADP-ribose pyrophosphatase YjhB (NUDIX family)